MDEQKIREIIRDEYNKIQGLDQFSSFQTSSHNHNGTDSPKINQSNIVPSVRASGSITFSQSTLYQLALTFNPTSVWFYGIAVNNSGSSPTIRAHCVGNAQLGPSYYFQPDTTTSVKIGGPIQNIIQSSTSFLVDSSVNPPVVRALVDEGNLVDVEYPTIVARATITAFTSESITVTVTVASGWVIIGNYLVT